jgi:hypothetical protein
MHMSAHGVDFLETWLDANVPYTGQENDLVTAGQLARRLVAAAALAGLSVEDLHLGPYSPATLIMKALVAPRDRAVTMPTSGQPFFSV